jgi:tRNA(His) 5'-end guanylyltransferase
MKKDSLGDRMKCYESVSRNFLTRRTPAIIRIDGKAFHTFTKHCIKPFDKYLNGAMVYTMEYLLNNIQGAKLGYTQSDEISILVTDFDTIHTDAWFKYNVQKMCSVSASIATAAFNSYYEYERLAMFDARVFNIPEDEVCNYFIWRQKDWERNSLQMLSRAHFSDKELHGKKRADMHEMLHSKGVNWTNLEDRWKNGCTIYLEDGKFIRDDESIFLDSHEDFSLLMGKSWLE